MNCHNCGIFINLELSYEEDANFQNEMEEHGVIALCPECYVPEETEIEELKRTHVELRGDEDDVVYRLRKRAEIRRQIPGRKSVQEGKPDRIADLFDEAANEIENLRGKPQLSDKPWDGYFDE